MTTELSELNQVAADLSAEQLRKVIAYARLQKQPYWTLAGYSSEWTEQDMRDATVASMRRFEQEHPGEDWSKLVPDNPTGYK
jgi:hypothetical protein